MPFTGPDAPFGPETLAGCVAAVKLINEAGGVLGHHVQCQSTNTQGDPADAVPAVKKMIATTNSLAGVLGPSSDEAPAVVPILNASKIPMFAISGQAEFDHTTDAYFWRTLPADDVLGYAMAIWAQRKGYLNGAAVFDNSVGAQSQIPTLTAGYTSLGGTLVVNLAIAPDLSSYRSEVARVLSSHPQVIFTEMDPQTGATFLSELKQLGNGAIPVIGDQVILEPSWLKAVGGAIGPSTLSSSCVAVQPYAPAQGAAWKTYSEALLASASQIQDASQYTADPYAMDPYDATVTMALAMIAANSTDPAVYNTHIPNVLQPSSSAAVVNNFQDGKTALAQGKTIRYVGALGPVAFDQWHNSTGAFDAVPCAVNQTKPLGTISSDDVAALTH